MCFFPSQYSVRLHHMSTPCGLSEYVTLYLHYVLKLLYAVYTLTQNSTNVLLMSLNTCHTPLPAIFRARRQVWPSAREEAHWRSTYSSFLSLHKVRLISLHHHCRGGQLTQFVQLTVTRHQAALSNSLTHQFSGNSESTSISILQITTASCYQLHAGSPPKGLCLDCLSWVSWIWFCATWYYKMGQNDHKSFSFCMNKVNGHLGLGFQGSFHFCLLNIICILLTGETFHRHINSYRDFTY